MENPVEMPGVSRVSRNALERVNLTSAAWGSLCQCSRCESSCSLVTHPRSPESFSGSDSGNRKQPKQTHVIRLKRALAEAEA